jgi:predicted Fe-Mo cluster-binding NifX family protein
MKVCFPVQQDEGMESAVFNHFGSAPAFVVFDTASGSIAAITNRDQHHAHGACNPLKALDNQQIDAVVVGGIGAGALARLSQAGIKVYRAQSKTVRENLTLYREQALAEHALQSCCGHGHGHAGGCAH